MFQNRRNLSLPISDQLGLIGCKGSENKRVARFFAMIILSIGGKGVSL